MNMKINIKDEDVQRIAKSITHAVFRNGEVENLHAENAVLDDSTMKTLNKDVYNRVYTLMTLYFCGETDKLLRVFEFEDRFGQNWDEPELVDEFLFEPETVN